MIAIKVLVLAAHPDDEVLGVGGTIARLTAEGHEVWVGILADGQTSRGLSAAPLMERFEQLKQAVTSLGAHVYLENAPFPDQKLDAYPVLEIARVIEKMIAVVEPERVYTHSASDLNQDHLAVHHATLIATRPVPDGLVDEVYAYEVPSSTEWAFGNITQPFRPNVFVDISGEYLEKKIAAMELYETERRAFPHPRSPEALRALAMYRGSQSGLLAAEAFQLIRVVR